MGGEVQFQGFDLLKADNEALREIRGNQISMIFQEPMTSLNPYLKIGTQLLEPIVLHKGLSKNIAWQECVATLKRVGIVEAESAMRSYPHEFSGGMRQRILIAMAIVTKPMVLVADEPTTALDVTVQSQILALLKDLQKQTGMAIIFITHDLGVIASVADRVIVMYAGRVFEEGTTEDIFRNPKHPYTYALLKSTPRLDVSQEVLPVIGGSPPDLSKIGQGCPFFDRCDLRLSKCETLFPDSRVIDPVHRSYCHTEVKSA